MRTINSSKIEWEVFPVNGAIHYCADGDGFVTLEQYENDNGENYWILCDQGSPVADINCFGENQSLGNALEIAQNYLAATYNEVFKQWEIK